MFLYRVYSQDHAFEHPILIDINPLKLPDLLKDFSEEVENCSLTGFMSYLTKKQIEFELLE